MDDTPLVSILIPVYNAQEYIEETIESLIEQTYSNIEIILVDDGSIDSSLKILREFEKNYKHIRVYSQKNSGASVARNSAFEKSTGMYIQYFDADDIMHKDKILFQIEALKHHSFNSKVVATGKWTKFYQDIETSVMQEQNIDKSYEDILLYFKESWENREYVIGQSWLIHRNLHVNVGQWKKELTLDDDGDFFARVAYGSKEIVFVKDSIVYWRQDNPESISKDPSSSAMQSRLDVFDVYLNIVEENANYKGLKEALAIKYSDHLLHTYFKYPDIASEVINRIRRLGFLKPIYPKSPKLTILITILGVSVAFNLLRIKNLIFSIKR